MISDTEPLENQMFHSFSLLNSICNTAKSGLKNRLKTAKNKNV